MSMSQDSDVIRARVLRTSPMLGISIWLLNNSRNFSFCILWHLDLSYMTPEALKFDIHLLNK
jgi:hypothetical protein